MVRVELKQVYFIELPYDPEVPLLGENSEKRKALIKKDPCTPMSVAELLTVAKTRKQPTWPATDSWFKTCVHTHIHTRWNVTQA